VLGRPAEARAEIHSLSGVPFPYRVASHIPAALIHPAVALRQGVHNFFRPTAQAQI